MRPHLRPRFSGFRRHYRSRAEKQRIRRRRRLLALVGVVGIAAAVIHARITPLLHVYAANAARTAMTEAINNAVAAVIDGSKLNYTDLVQVRQGEDDRIFAIESDVLKINRLKAEVTDAIVEELKNIRYHQVSVPIGDLSGFTLLLGRGPRIPVHISVSGSVQTGVESRFFSAGINQTDHQIRMMVELQLFSPIPGGSENIKVQSQFLIAETVLLGDVPDSYTNVVDDERDTVEKIFDYGDTG